MGSNEWNFAQLHKLSRPVHSWCAAAPTHPSSLFIFRGCRAIWLEVSDRRPVAFTNLPSPSSTTKRVSAVGVWPHSGEAREHTIVFPRQLEFCSSTPYYMPRRSSSFVVVEPAPYAFFFVFVLFSFFFFFFCFFLSSFHARCRTRGTRTEPAIGDHTIHTGLDCTIGTRMNLERRIWSARDSIATSPWPSSLYRFWRLRLLMLIRRSASALTFFPPTIRL